MTIQQSNIMWRAVALGLGVIVTVFGGVMLWGVGEIAKINGSRFTDEEGDLLRNRITMNTVAIANLPPTWISSDLATVKQTLVQIERRLQRIESRVLDGSMDSGG